MNQRVPGFLLPKCIDGFLQFKAAEALSPRTIVSYEHHLRVWSQHAGEIQVGRITTQDLRAFIAWLRTEYQPRRVSGAVDPLSPKTIRNFWITMSAFFTWASDEFQLPNPMKGVAPPKFEDKPFESYTQEEVEALLKACDFCQEARTEDRRKFAMRRPTANRDRALIVTLLDTLLSRMLSLSRANSMSRASDAFMCWRSL